MGGRDRFTPPNDKEIMEILDLLNESDFDELRLEMTDFKLVFSKNAIDSSDQISEKTKSSMVPGEFTPAESEKEPARDMHDPEAPGRCEEEGLIPIKAPLLGIFYRAPKPGAPPFVEVGDRVTEEDTVCLVEVMKLFNTVKAGVKGRIAKICAENSQMVEYNQPLFLVDPAAIPEAS